MRRAPNSKFYFALTAATIVAGAAFLYFQNGSLDAMRTDVEKLREQSREQKQIYSKLNDSQKSLVQLREQLAHLEQNIPDAAYVPTMLKELETFGKQQGIEVTGLRPLQTGAALAAAKDKDKDKDKKPYDQLELELKGRGKYSNLVGFVKSLNDFPEIVAARTINVSPTAKGKTAPDGTLDIVMNLRAFMFKQRPIPAATKKDGGPV